MFFTIDFIINFDDALCINIIQMIHKRENIKPAFPSPSNRGFASFIDLDIGLIQMLARASVVTAHRPARTRFVGRDVAI